MQIIASKPFKCPIIGQNMGEILSGIQIGAAKHIYYMSDHLAQILHQQLWEPNICTVSFLIMQGPVSYLFL